MRLLERSLKNLFPSQTKAYIVPVSKSDWLYYIHFMRQKDSKDSADEHARHLAHAIVDTLNAGSSCTCSGFF